MPVLDYKTMKSRPAWNSYAKGVTQNWGKRATPLIPHVRNRILGKRSRASSVASGQSMGSSSASTVRYGGRIPQGQVMNEGTGGQCSYFYGKKRKSYLPKHVLDALAPQVIQSNGAAQLLSGIGKQNVAAALTLFQPSVATGFTTDTISRVVYDTASGDVTMNNIYLSNAYIIIYDIIARKDVASGTVANPLLAWSQGNTDESNTNAYTDLGSTPWQSEAFNQYWKVCQVTNIVLCAGGTHVHKVRLSPKRSISASYATYTNLAFKDLTYWTLIEVHGAPANAVTTQTQVSVGVGGLNIIADQEVRLRQLQNSKPIVSVNNTLPTTLTGGEQVVNLGGSTITTQAEG